MALVKDNSTPVPRIIDTTAGLVYMKTTNGSNQSTITTQSLSTGAAFEYVDLHGGFEAILAQAAV